MPSTTTSFNQDALDLFAKANTGQEKTDLLVRAVAMVLSAGQVEELADAFAEAKTPEPPKVDEPGSQG